MPKAAAVLVASIQSNPPHPEEQLPLIYIVFVSAALLVISFRLVIKCH